VFSSCDSLNTHEDHHPHGLEDVDVDMDGGVDPVLSIISLWKGNHQNIECNVEVHYEGESKAKSKVSGSTEFSGSSGLLLDNDNHNDYNEE